MRKQQNPFINLCQDLMRFPRKAGMTILRNERLLLSLVQTFIFYPKGKTIEALDITNKAESERGILEI